MPLIFILSGCGPAAYAGISVGLTIADKALGLTDSAVRLWKDTHSGSAPAEPPIAETN